MLRDKHGLLEYEVEEAVENRKYARRAKNGRHMLLGQSDDGAYITVICEMKGAVAVIVTAYPMDESDKKLLRKIGRV